MAKYGLAAQMWKAVGQLNPHKPVQETRKDFTAALVGNDVAEIRSIKEVLLGTTPLVAALGAAAASIKEYLHPLDEHAVAALREADFQICAPGAESGVPAARGARVVYDPSDPGRLLSELAGAPELADIRLAMAFRFPGFRTEFAHRMVRDVSKENAIFVILSAAGSVLPSPLLPLIGIAEAASDTVVLTANQVRMLFLIGAVHGEKVGYAAQWKEISSVIGAAFGWRAIARELVSKIPFGGGLVPKGAIAYAGTSAVGESMVYFYTTGKHMTRAQMSQVFKDTYSRAAGTVKSLVERFKSGGAEETGAGVLPG